jgi:hypothetical protein
MLFLLLIILMSPLFAQDNSSLLTGILLEKGTKKPLKDVSVFILPAKLKSVTNEKGEFVFENAPSEKCSVIINLTGYNKFEKKLDCGKVKSLPIYLEKKFYTTFETTVTSKVNKRDDQSQSLTQEEFLGTPGSFGGDPVRAAQNLPGVAATGGSAQVIVQGSSPDDTGYLLNGHRVPLVFHFGGLSSVVIPQAVERVDLLPSGYGPEYSRAIGGIIGLTTKDPLQDRIHGMAYVDSFNAGALLEGPIDDKSSFFVAGRYSYIGYVLKAVSENSDAVEITSAPVFYDLTSIYKRKLNDKNEFKTTFVLSHDELVFVLNKPANDDPSLRGKLQNDTGFFRIIPQLTTQINAKHKLDNSVALGKDNININVSGQFLEVDSNVISQRSELASNWKPTYKTYLGLDNQWNNTRTSVNLPTNYSVGGISTPFSVGEERKFDTEGSQTQLGAYLRQEIKTSEESKWTYLPNLRVDHFTINTETQIQPRFQLRYQWDPSLLLRGAWGKYVQAPRPQESSRLYGNNDVRSPFAFHYMVGYTKDFRQGSNQGLEFTNNFFYKELKDLVVPDVEKRYSNDGTGTIQGAEVQAKYRKDEWSSQIVYTYLKSRRHIPGFGSQPSEFDQTHNLNLIGAYNTPRWTFSGRLRFVTGAPYTPVTGASYDSDNDVYIPSAGTIYSQRFEAFKQLDIRIDRKYIYDTWILTVYLDVQNLTNSNNTQSFEYSYDYSKKEKGSGLPILPTFGIKGEF